MELLDFNEIAEVINENFSVHKTQVCCGPFQKIINKERS